MGDSLGDQIVTRQGAVTELLKARLVRRALQLTHVYGRGAPPPKYPQSRSRLSLPHGRAVILTDNQGQALSYLGAHQ